MEKTSENKSPQLVKFEKIWKVFNVLFLIYIAAVTYSACSVYGVDLAYYLRPITVIPGWLVLLVAIGLQYVIQNLKNNDPISFAEFKKDLSAFLKHVRLDRPLQLYLGYLWKSFKVVFLRTLVFALLMIPVLLILSVVMSIVTFFLSDVVVNTSDFSCSWHM